MESSAAKIIFDSLPPMLRMYLDYKEKYPDALLFFQVGDFYELFFEDAVKSSRMLGLTLTSRDKNSENPIPMCGVPISVVDSYLDKLVNQGHSVAVVKQVGDPNAKKGMVDRELERIVTPGIRILGGESKDREDNFVASIFVSTLGSDFSIAYTDVRTGKAFVKENLDKEALIAEIRSIVPAEVVIPREFEGKRLDRRSSWIKEIETVLGNPSILKFRQISKDSTRQLTLLDGYISLSELSKKSIQLLLGYIDETTVGTSIKFTSVSRDFHENCLLMDATSRKNLELVSNLRDGGLHGTLLSIFDSTKTSQGGRKIRQWLLKPSRVKEEIKARQDSVKFLFEERSLRQSLSSALSQIGDLERISTRVDLGAASPRELGAMRDSLQALEHLMRVLSEIKLPSLLYKLSEGLKTPKELLLRMTEILLDELPGISQEGGIIREGYNQELDRLRSIRSNGKSLIAALEVKEKERSGISSLKVRFNSVFGYYIEITRSNLEKVPSNYVRKQTMVNAERFITEELKQMEEEILNAESKQFQIEKRIFIELIEFLKSFTASVRSASEAVSVIDVLLSLAEVAERDNLVLPQICQESLLHIEKGQHPVLSHELQNNFVANSLMMNNSDRQLLLLTGPNMGGKSTYLKQTALIVILAQIGSYVPAESVKLSIVDKIFTRIGASDNMMEGESTFMVEMREAGYILSNASEHSLLLIDELGRGTATQDGLGIARATLEWIVEKIGAKTLFATHFHELTELEGVLPGLYNLSVGSADLDGQIIFTHSICEGPANKSYGLEVARIAGLPSALLERARLIMSENHENPSSNAQLLMFNKDSALSRKSEKIVEPSDYKTLKELKRNFDNLDINHLSPLQALNWLSEIKK